MLLIIKCINSIFFGEVYMKFKKIYNRLLCRLDKTDFTNEEAMEIYSGFADKNTVVLLENDLPDNYLN